MRFSAKFMLVVLGMLATTGTAPVDAAEWSRSTIHGGQMTRSVHGNGVVYSSETTRVGPNGGIYTSTAACLNGIVARCRRSYSAVGPNGQSFSGHRASARGPYRLRSVRSVTGPRGNTAVGVHRRWR